MGSFQEYSEGWGWLFSSILILVLALSVYNLFRDPKPQTEPRPVPTQVLLVDSLHRAESGGCDIYFRNTESDETGSLPVMPDPCERARALVGRHVFLGQKRRRVPSSRCSGEACVETVAVQIEDAAVPSPLGSPAYLLRSARTGGGDCHLVLESRASGANWSVPSRSILCAKARGLIGQQVTVRTGTHPEGDGDWVVTIWRKQ